MTSYPRWLWIALGLIFLNTLLLTTGRRLLTAVILGITFALIAVSYTTHIPTPETIDSYANSKLVTIHGIISAEPDRRPMQTKYTVEVHTLTNSSGTVIPVTGKTLITDNEQWPEFDYGDGVEVTGKLERPEPIEDFHYDRYLSRYDVYSVMYRARLTRIDEGHGNPFFAVLFKTKQSFEYQINRLYAEPHASFLAGLLTGSRKGIPDHLLDDFQITGLTHIIAISGYNITIVISVIAGMLFWLPLRQRFIPSIIAIAAFTLFVGASAAVVRASIMGILGLMALQAGRQSHTRLAILWTLFFMLMWNPKYLWYDAGFQMSFLAVIGLTELASHLERWFTKVPKVLGIREALQMTIAAQICAVPLIVLLFGRLSLIAPIANVLVAPAIPLAMLFGFIGTVLSFIWFPLGQIFAYIAWAFLQWIVLVAKILAHVPFASVEVPWISISFIIGYYGLLVMIVYRFKRGK
ncbi:ComEC family competence protein [Patescibacteria group bacterium]|nr:ComEC family competence protein [Patescibacteria group bacterium]